MYLVISIVGGIGLGWIIGNYLLDRWINESQEEIDHSVDTKTKEKNK